MGLQRTPDGSTPSSFTVSPVGPILANSMLLHSLDFARFPLPGRLPLLHGWTTSGGAPDRCTSAVPPPLAWVDDFGRSPRPVHVGCAEDSGGTRRVASREDVDATTSSPLQQQQLVEKPPSQPPTTPPVADTVLQKPDQPVPVDSVKVRPDVRIDNPSDPTPSYPVSQGVERIMRPTSGSEPIAESEELRLVYRQKDGLRHRLLDNLVLHCGDAQRSCSPVRLRYLYPPRRTRPVRSALNPFMQGAQPFGQTLFRGPGTTTGADWSPLRSPAWTYVRAWVLTGLAFRFGDV